MLPSRTPGIRSQADYQRLLIFAQDMKQWYFATGIKRSSFWVAAIHVAYSAQLQLGDLLGIRFDDIDDDGILSIATSTKGHRTSCQLSPETIEAIDAIRFPRRKLVFPWPGVRSWFFEFVRLAAAKSRQIELSVDDVAHSIDDRHATTTNQPTVPGT